MSLITIKVIDDKGQPVRNATMTWLQNGNVINRVAVPSNTGVIYLDTADDSYLLQSGTRMKATAFGYTTTETDADRVGEFSDFTFTMQANGLATAVIVGAGAGIALLLLAQKGGKKKMAGFNDLPPAAQTGIVFGGLGLAAYLIFFAGKKPPGGALVTAARAALQGLAAAGLYPSISDAQAETYASSLRTAFNDCGTDENEVMSVMQRMQNTADVWLLVAVYGTREYKGCFDGDYFGMHQYNLSEAITAEMSSYWINAINQQFSSNGIDFKF